VADEGHQALAVRGVLEHGVPLVPSGNVYLRGAPFIYAEAAAAAFLGVNELSLRLPAALFGALAVVLVYAYGRMLFEFSLEVALRAMHPLPLTFLASLTFYRATSGRLGTVPPPGSWR
jgi:4-amino-4-deoxy-L-arabinose transferase-like glycosyltransferase